MTDYDEDLHAVFPPTAPPARCRDGMCGALDCPRCYPVEWDADAEDETETETEQEVTP